MIDLNVVLAHVSRELSPHGHVQPHLSRDEGGEGTGIARARTSWE